MQEGVSDFEGRLVEEIEKISINIKELEHEKAALERQLMKARRANSDLKDVTRKNSMTRVMVEARVLRFLGEARKPVRTEKLFQDAVFANVRLKKNTFRTYLHRMKTRGLIASAGRGLWSAVPSTTDV